jgi:diphthine-ammonia ligase
MPNNTNIIIYLKIHNTPQSSSLRKALHVQSRSYWAPANIGPYSQAISILLPSLEDQESKIWTASVAGQIPLIPSTMILPPPQNDDGSSNPEDLLDNFKLQTVLSLQHLWRIGEEMDVQWWTSIVAYLPRGPAQRLSQPAQIAGQAWTLIHRRPVLEEDDENDESRDLWEEKNYAGMENRGGRKEKRALPDWEIVESVHGDEVNSPPFFAVEVEELPRGAGIEWHAHLGVTDGPIKVSLLIGSGLENSLTIGSFIRVGARMVGLSINVHSEMLFSLSS